MKVKNNGYTALILASLWINVNFYKNDFLFQRFNNNLMMELKALKNQDFDFIKSIFSSKNIQDYDLELINDLLKNSKKLAKESNDCQWDEIITYLTELKDEVLDDEWKIIKKYEKEKNKAQEYLFSFIGQKDENDYENIMPDDLILDRNLVKRGNLLVNGITISDIQENLRNKMYNLNDKRLLYHYYSNII